MQFVPLCACMSPPVLPLSLPAPSIVSRQLLVVKVHSTCSGSTRASCTQPSAVDGTQREWRSLLFLVPEPCMWQCWAAGVCRNRLYIIETSGEMLPPFFPLRVIAVPVCSVRIKLGGIDFPVPATSPRTENQ